MPFLKAAAKMATTGPCCRGRSAIRALSRSSALSGPKKRWLLRTTGKPSEKKANRERATLADSLCCFGARSGRNPLPTIVFDDQAIDALFLIYEDNPSYLLSDYKDILLIHFTQVHTAGCTA